MAFLDKIDQSVTHKIVLFEYDLPVNNDVLINYEAGIWFNILTPGDKSWTDDNGNLWYYTNTNEIEYNIQSLKIGSQDYTKVNSLTDLRIQNASFYYDALTTKIYIHFDSWEPPLDKIILLGSVTGYSTEADRELGAYYENVYYEPRITSIPNLNTQKDPLFFGKIAFNSGSISLANNDGQFDNFEDENAYRQAGRILFGFENETYDEYKKVFTGYLENYSNTFETFTVTIQDIRKSLSRSIPINYLNLIEFPDLEPDNVDYPKPIAYGYINQAPVICLNELADPIPDNYEYMLADTTNRNIHSVVEIYEGETDITSTATWSVDLTTGILSIDSDDVDDITDIYVSFYGYKDDSGNVISNAMSVIKDLMLYYADISFIDTNFNTTMWNLATASAIDIGIFIDDDVNLIDKINDIIASTHGIFYAQIDGKYSAKIFNSNRDPVKTIYNYEWIGQPSVKNNGSEFLSSIRISYNKNLRTDRYEQYINSDYEENALLRYKSYKQRTLETLITSSSDAEIMSDLIMQQSYFVRNIIQRKVKMSHYDLELGDFIIANPSTRPDGDIDNFYVYEIIGKNINFNTFEITLTMKYIQDYEETEIIYTQGFLYYDKLYYEKLYGDTQFNEV